MELGRRLGEHKVVAKALNTLGYLERHRDNLEYAISRYEESLTIYRELGDRTGMALGLISLGDGAHGRGENEQPAPCATPWRCTGGRQREGRCPYTRHGRV